METIWEQITFDGKIRPISKPEYVRMTTRVYKANPEAYRKKMKMGYRDLMSLFDTNMDDKIDKDEHVCFLQCMNHNNIVSDKASFWEAYHETDGVPLVTVVDQLVQFKTNSTRRAKIDNIDAAFKLALKP